MMSDQQIQCRRCGEEKPRDAFYSYRHTTAPRMPCKTCHNSEKRARYATQDGDRASHAQVLREKYNLTPAEYDRMLAAQDGRCAICLQPETARGRGGQPRRLAVNADHRFGTVRQLLCHRCNLVTWAVEENPSLLDAVRAYLLRHAPTHSPEPPVAESR